MKEEVARFFCHKTSTWHPDRVPFIGLQYIKGLFYMRSKKGMADFEVL